MNAKSIYDKLVNVEGVPSSILTYSDKNDCIIIEVQDYDKSVFKFAKEFFKGYKSTDIIYTNEDKTAIWYNEVSVYSDRETIEAITDFYYRAKAKGLVESKKSSRKSIKEEYDPTDDIVNKGNSVSMDYETFIKFTDGLGIRFNTKDAKIVYLSNDIKMEFGDSVLVIPKDDILDIVVNAHSSMEIKSKFIEQVASVSLDKNDILRADFFTKEGNVLTVWWEV